MRISALFPLLLALLCHDAFGRAPEGVLGRENVEEETNGTGEGAAPSSEVKQGDLTPWEPRSWSSERRRRSLGGESQGYHERGQEPSSAEGGLAADKPGGEGAASFHASPQAPFPAPAPALPVTSHLPQPFMLSDNVRAPGGVSGLYLPPPTEPPPSFTPNLNLQIITLSSLVCPQACQIRIDGSCEFDAKCIFG
ncbi:uncharacterized protein LOC122247270 [Penaeus japonicus]|uniref:uncharacterized protein LOC122247270 n=1 Tax=Penaeus japonicus TaxID=27405 RepID=UPI001C713B21|nr:uncharacterized protein LOC122247270 [Penaeus japonicus]XP_042862344.1 uncharacterized protein LOC122247270 [Penaeus japonicus]